MSAPDLTSPAVPAAWDVLRCPLTGQTLQLATVGTVLGSMRESGRPSAIGLTPTLLVRRDGTAGYPIVDGTPVLLGPELIALDPAVQVVDLDAPQYSEAYAEMDHYNGMAAKAASSAAQLDLERSGSPTWQNLWRIRSGCVDATNYPRPLIDWVDSRYDVAAEGDVHRFFHDVRGKRVLQLGGAGTGAVKLLLAGATQAWLMSPMLGELALARAVAAACGVEDRLFCVAGVAEELPFADETFEAVWAAGCVHHMVTAVALPEAARVLATNGRFGAIEPWRAPGYGIGTKIFGTQEWGAKCRPLTRERAAPLFSAFGRARIIQHGALTRYPLVTLGKFHLAAPPKLVWKITTVDDLICSAIPGMRGLGSCASLLGVKLGRTNER